MTAGPRIGGIHHVAIVVASIDESLVRYRALFGLRPESPPRIFASQRVRLVFLTTGQETATRLELIEPIDAESGVARYLAAHGEGVHHVCFETADLPATLEALAAAEVDLIDRVPREGAHGTVAFIHPRSLNGVLWELLEPAPSAGAGEGRGDPDG